MNKITGSLLSLIFFGLTSHAAATRTLDCTAVIDANVPNSGIVNTMVRYSMPTLTYTKKDSGAFAEARTEYTLKDATGKPLAVISTDSFLIDAKSAHLSIMIKDENNFASLGSASADISLSKDGYDSKAMELSVPEKPYKDAVINGADTSDFSDVGALKVQVTHLTAFCSLR